jgi:high-affinity nickel permease
MFGLDDHIASLSDGASLVVVLAVAVLLGLRHATDPDHLAAVTTLIAGSRERHARSAARLGLAWGCGHAVTLFALGVPIVLYAAYLPDAFQRTAETAVGFLIAGLAVWLLLRWRRGAFHAHEHEHDGARHTHLHSHARPGAHRHVRSPLGAFGIGLLHGVGGSAGVGILIVSTIDGRAVALAGLGVLAVFTAVSMTLLTTGFGLGLHRVSPARFAPALGLASLAFGVWYALGAQGMLPYYF